MESTDKAPHRGVVTYDTRPLAQRAGNRSDEIAPELSRRKNPLSAHAERAAEQFRRDGGAAQIPQGVEPAEALLVQVGSIFAYAMLGAVLFHAAWWLLSAT